MNNEKYGERKKKDAREKHEFRGENACRAYCSRVTIRSRYRVDASFFREEVHVYCTNLRRLTSN